MLNLLANALHITACYCYAGGWTGFDGSAAQGGCKDDDRGSVTVADECELMR